jgi:hypothetical protein
MLSHGYYIVLVVIIFISLSKNGELAGVFYGPVDTGIGKVCLVLMKGDVL